MTLDGLTVRCADWAVSQGVQLIGTAPVANGVLIVEWPSSWPRDVTEISELETVTSVARSAGIRVQLVRRQLAAPERVVGLYRRSPEAPFQRLQHIEAHSSHGRIAAAALELLHQPLTDERDSSQVLDVLVCAHGTRDVCCGSRGTRLAHDVVESLDIPGCRVWRTSHLGGHRFAPTVLLLPAGTIWGHVDELTLPSIVRQELSPEIAAEHLRGTIALVPSLQLLERMAFGAVGWSWFDSARYGHVDGDAVVLHGRSPSGELVSWTGSVTTRRLLTVPDCGGPADSGGKVEAELALVRAARLVN